MNVCLIDWRIREGGGKGDSKGRGEEEEGGRVSIEGQGGWGWEERGSEGKEGGEEANWASTHTSPPPIRVTHLPFTQYITLHF